MDKGGGTRSRKNRSGSCSSRVDANFVTYDADVDQVDIDEEDHLNNSDNAIIDSDDDDDAGISSIVNDYPSEDDTILADEQKEESTLSAVRTRRTEQITSQQKDFCWLAKQWSVSYRIPSLTRWTVRNVTLTSMKGKSTFICRRLLSRTIYGKPT